eukprot:COSAG02_NODE_1446_length_12578_cov_3.488661_10_plen_216_part_00
MLYSSPSVGPHIDSSLLLVSWILSLITSCACSALCSDFKGPSNLIGASGALGALAPTPPCVQHTPCPHVLTSLPTGVYGVSGDSRVTLNWLAPVDIGGSALLHYTIINRSHTNDWGVKRGIMPKIMLASGWNAAVLPLPFSVIELRINDCVKVVMKRRLEAKKLAQKRRLEAQASDEANDEPELTWGGTITGWVGFPWCTENSLRNSSGTLTPLG